ncbi:MAG: heat-inducible transcriptional repressor HrcA [Gammaproteobacteria bacterium]
MASEINERSQRLLKVLIESYIRDGQPVGSRYLAKESGLDLSAATVRNVMSDLEDMGLVVSPHTSAGRVPTIKGYRMFVDSLLTVKNLDTTLFRQMQIRLDSEDSLADLAGSVSSLLSSITSMAGIVMLPRKEQFSFRQIEFMSLADNRVLVILVINDKEVQNRVIHTKRQYTSNELQKAANYLNSIFTGKSLTQVRKHLLSELRNTRESMAKEMQEAIVMAEQVFADETESQDFIMSGETNLMEYAELSRVDKLRNLFDAFNEKQQILHLLDQCINTQGMQIFIGEESGYKVLDECSMVTSTYDVDGEVVGVLGVIGPTRMAYERVIPLVDVTAKMVSSALNTKQKVPING